MNARATRADVARLAGVSTAVVSYVLNDGPRPVAPGTRDRVKRAIDELGYRPNASARALALAESKLIGLLVPDISNPFFSEFAKYVQDSAATRDRSVVIGNTDLDPNIEVAQLEMVIGLELDGVIVFGIRDQHARERLTSAGVSLVSMDWQFQDADVATVVADDYGAARAAVEHLREHGHREIAYIGGPPELLVSQARRQAWLDVVGVNLSPKRLNELEQAAPHTREGGLLMAERLSRVSHRPTAVFISSDIQAIGALHAFYEADIRVPEDLAVVSFDGTHDSRYSNPALTAVQLPLRLMAEHAVAKLLGEGRHLGLHSTVPHRLLIRDSCGCGSDGLH